MIQSLDDTYDDYIVVNSKIRFFRDNDYNAFYIEPGSSQNELEMYIAKDLQNTLNFHGGYDFNLTADNTVNIKTTVGNGSLIKIEQNRIHIKSSNKRFFLNSNGLYAGTYTYNSPDIIGYQASRIAPFSVLSNIMATLNDTGSTYPINQVEIYLRVVREGSGGYITASILGGEVCELCRWSNTVSQPNGGSSDYCNSVVTFALIPSAINASYTISRGVGTSFTTTTDYSSKNYGGSPVFLTFGYGGKYGSAAFYYTLSYNDSGSNGATAAFRTSVTEISSSNLTANPGNLKLTLLGMSLVKL